MEPTRDHRRKNPELCNLIVTDSGLQHKNYPQIVIVGLKFRSSFFTPRIAPYHLTSVSFLMDRK